MRRAASPPTPSAAASCRCAPIPRAHGGGVTPRPAGSTSRRSTSPRHAPRVADEAVALLTAPPCPAGASTIVLHGEQVALQLHESIGHALELDRMLLGEASYAGTSWVAPGDLGALRYGSELLNVTADATLPGGLGSFGWDDEGVAARAHADSSRAACCAPRCRPRERRGRRPRRRAAARAPTASRASRSCA